VYLSRHDDEEVLSPQDIDFFIYIVDLLSFFKDADFDEPFMGLGPERRVASGVIVAAYRGDFIEAKGPEIEDEAFPGTFGIDIH
jgi:hypothetical protein